MHLKLQGSIALRSGQFNKIPITEISGIAWDKDENLLYAVSDEGYLYHLEVTLKNNNLDELKVIFATKLRSRDGTPLRGKYKDAEGLATQNTSNGIKGDSQLFISFENTPRIDKFTIDGRQISYIKLPNKINHKNKFRHKNKALESVANHAKYGVISAAEYPIKNRPTNIQTLYSSTGKEWNFTRSKATNSAITGLEILQNGDVLVLERAYKNLFSPVVINLRRLHLEGCNKKRFCATETIARFDTSDGWAIDNFEGLAHYKDNQFFMISDDNKSPFQKTILVLFEVLAKPDKATNSQ